MNADRTLLTDVHWALLAPLLPPSRMGRRGVMANGKRGFVEAVLWVGPGAQQPGESRAPRCLKGVRGDSGK